MLKFAEPILNQAVSPGGVARVAGIDLGSHSAKIVLATGDAQQPTIVAAARIAIPQTAVDDPVEQAAKLGQWIRKWSAYSADHVHCSLPPRFSDYEATPGLQDDGDVESNVARAIEQILGDSASDATCDYWETESHNGSLLHLIWASNEVTHAVPRELARWGLSCRGLEASTTALARVPRNDAGDAQLVVDLGRDAATAVLVEAGAPTYVRQRVAVSARSAVQSVAEALKLSPAAAETLLGQWGCDETAGPLARQVAFLLDGWLRELHFELQRTLSFVDHCKTSGGIARVVLCGGGAALRGLPAWLADKLGVPVAAAPAPAVAWAAAEPFSPVFALACAMALSEERA